VEEIHSIHRRGRAKKNQSVKMSIDDNNVTED